MTFTLLQVVVLVVLLLLTIIRRKDKFKIVSQLYDKDGRVLWRVLINDKKSFYANFKTVPPGVPYHIEDWQRQQD